MRVKPDARLQADRTRMRELRKCQSSLWYLSTETLGYKWDNRKRKGLTERLHKPICDRIDRHRERQHDAVFFGRGLHKSTIIVCCLIQDFLIEPSSVILYWHEVEEQAGAIVGEVAWHFQHNDKLRYLDPVGVYDERHLVRDQIGQRFNIFPAKNAKKFLTMTGGGKMTVANRQGKPRWASLIGRGVGSENSGEHGDKCYMDDTCARKTRDEGQMANRISWFGSTVYPVIDGRRFRAFGTLWEDWGLYHNWIKEKKWNVLVLPASIEENLEDVDWTKRKLVLKPKKKHNGNYDYSNPIYGIDREFEEKRLRAAHDQMKAEFGPQMMMEAQTSSELKWNQKMCEHPKISQHEALLGAGTLFLLSDPCPYGTIGVGEQKRKGGDKDEWSMAVLRMQAWRGRLRLVLIQGAASRLWRDHEGCDVAAGLMSRYGVRYGIFENINKDWSTDLHRACVDHGFAPFLESRGEKMLLPQFERQRVLHAKNMRHSNLCDMASRGCFVISEECDEEFLNGKHEGDRMALMYQLRKWEDRIDGSNGLPHDDRGDAVSYGTDPVLLRFSPRVDLMHQSHGKEWLGDVHVNRASRRQRRPSRVAHMHV